MRSGASSRAGDEALAQALRSLLALGAISKEGTTYVLTPWGAGDLAIGSGLLVVSTGALQSA